MTKIGFSSCQKNVVLKPIQQVDYSASCGLFQQLLEECSIETHSSHSRYSSLQQFQQLLEECSIETKYGRVISDDKQCFSSCQKNVVLKLTFVSQAYRISGSFSSCQKNVVLKLSVNSVTGTDYQVSVVVRRMQY